MSVFVKTVPSVIDFKNGCPVIIDIYILFYVQENNTYQLITDKLLTEKKAKLIKDKILAKGSVDLTHWERVYM